MGATLQAFKEFQRITHDDEDSTLEGFIQACTDYFQWRTGRTIWQTTYEYTLPYFPDCGMICLPYGQPLIEVTSIKYRNSDGVETTWSSAEYVTDEHGEIAPAYGTTWPSFTPYPLSAVRIRYKAGIAYASPQSEYPKDGIVKAICQLAGAMYENRESVVATDRATVAAFAENPLTKYLIERFKAKHAF